MPKTSVCLFTDSLSPSGVGQHMISLAEELLDEYRLILVCPPTAPGLDLLERARKLGVTPVGLEVRGGDNDRRPLEDVLRTHHIDVFHCHAGVTWEGHQGVRAAREAQVPALVRTEHLTDLTTVFPLEELPDLVYSPYHLPDRRPGRDELSRMVAEHRADYQRMIDAVDLLICVSQGVRDSYSAAGVDDSKMRVVRNGIQPVHPSADAREVKSRLGVSAHRRMVLSVGRIIDVKGHLFMLGAVEEVARRCPDALFVWVGGGPLETELGEQVRARGLDEHVLLAGQRDDVSDVIAASDVLVLASLVEGLPLVVLEAMAAARPVVGTRVCGTSEVIVDGLTGRLVEPGTLDGNGDTDALAEAILQPLEDRELAARWGRAGQGLFEQEFTRARMAKETAAIYGELLHRSQP